MKSSRTKLLLAGSLLGLSLGAAHAAAPLPPLQHRGATEYLSGGIGKDEARAIEAAAPLWPLTLEFAVQHKQRADFAADVKVQLRDAKGMDVLQATADGPFLLAKLPPGRYGIEASFAGKTLQRMVVVKQGQPAKAVFVWPAGTGEGQAHGARP